MPISDHTNPKIIKITFSFPNFAPECKISVHSIYSFWRYNQLQSPITRLATPIFDNAHLKKFWSAFNLCELALTCKKSGHFIDLFWRYGWLLNPAIWLAKNILAHTSGIWDLYKNTANNISFHYRINSVKINDQIFQ